MIKRFFWVFLWLVGVQPVAFAFDVPTKITWLTVSDREELHRTWTDALTFLPPTFGKHSVKSLAIPGRLNEIVEENAPKPKVPTILFLHSCEGLGHHREDLHRLARLGFLVIAPDSFARNYRPLGCYEEQERFIRLLDLSIAFQKAELDYAIERLDQFDWIDRENIFLYGSGIGGMVAAHYQGKAFVGHVIEGWGCRGPNPVFDGIWSDPSVRIYSTVSRNDPWYVKNPGFKVDCAPFIEGRDGSQAIVLERPAHYVAWYPKSYKGLIEFLVRDLEVDVAALSADDPIIVAKADDQIELKEKWSDRAVYAAAKSHCERFSKRSRLIAEPRELLYKFKCE